MGELAKKRVRAFRILPAFWAYLAVVAVLLLLRWLGKERRAFAV